MKKQKHLTLDNGFNVEQWAIFLMEINFSTSSDLVLFSFISVVFNLASRTYICKNRFCVLYVKFQCY